ncbi:MAG: SDR family NAD(P)-dependent oxidoreductase [Propionibacteriaceae bacterium]|jgi:short-subunit dehydrogenase|nr:SDR family NAD(P)-dependent oxidoreductase [Propionibacteriaceae bacterium]
MATALVTGGTSGIGLAFAEALARLGDDLVLVARDVERMQETAADLHARFAVNVETMVADLSVRNDINKVRLRLLDDAHPVDTLVNNAGFGLHTALLDEDMGVQERAMTAMMTAVLLLSNAAGRAMRERGRGVIINVSSASSWIYTGNYSAIKRWVLSYTQALALELEDTGVRVVATCPGWAKTRFHERSGVPRPKLPEFAWVKPEQVVKEALAAAAVGQVVSIPSRTWKIALWIAQHGPQAIPRWFSRKISRSRALK